MLVEIWNTVLPKGTEAVKVGVAGEGQGGRTACHRVPSTDSHEALRPKAHARVLQS